ncbi:hypothetical protein CY34DRAFT_811465 [Suillus luteus UH-Slu-Lm8-n1]|uniref:Uncharacterized protein n=2 Tax=Suillus luteus UH-Slu-Lm8-n1 TaxID=930992 RepID=A0A0D0APD3_9AGAM|nr:hypothetical protein CY34DRAFT_811465 [Suillus luteus UH-Slu-Lm8-n1]
MEGGVTWKYVILCGNDEFGRPPIQLSHAGGAVFYADVHTKEIPKRKLRKSIAGHICPRQPKRCHLQLI